MVKLHLRLLRATRPRGTGRQRAYPATRRGGRGSSPTNHMLHGPLKMKPFRALVAGIVTSVYRSERHSYSVTTRAIQCSHIQAGAARPGGGEERSPSQVGARAER